MPLLHMGVRFSAFIHESIKTRVETKTKGENNGNHIMHLSMNPLKQGLKPTFNHSIKGISYAFIHESIKTRVETRSPVGRG